jgi:23S rRNA maturation-related 3'-5' exoribonuclease YhaM
MDLVKDVVEKMIFQITRYTIAKMTIKDGKQTKFMILLFPVFSDMVIFHGMTRLALDQVEAMGQFLSGRFTFAFTRRV